MRYERKERKELLKEKSEIKAFRNGLKDTMKRLRRGK